jgi:5'-3' exonuclease
MPPKIQSKIQINQEKPIILVDSSYTSFYRFFATLRWFAFAYPDEFKELKNNNTYDWKTNKIFIEKYEKMYLESIIKLVKKTVFNKSKIVFCMDTPKAELWRTELHCEYKGDRADLSLKHNFKPTFEYTYNKMIPNFISSNNNIYGFRVDKMEADDLIAIITLHYKEKHPNTPIYIVSGDEDFLQLGGPNINFVNYKLKKSFTLTEDEAKESLRNKFIMGDTSDCIPSIFPKGSRVKKKEIIESEEKLTEYLNNNPEAKKQYEFNKRMIDFNNIPKKYRNEVIKLLDILLENSNNQISENKQNKQIKKKVEKEIEL